jgi:hypothetical protein
MTGECFGQGAEMDTPGRRVIPGSEAGADDYDYDYDYDYEHEHEHEGMG